MRFVLMHVSTHSRGKGHSSVAAAAYRLGVRMRDERTGITYDYGRKGLDGVAASVHVVPDGAAEELREVGQCWNAAEAAENRKDSQVCRDFRESVPLGLDEAAATAMMQDWASYLSDRYNTPITAALHRDNARDVTGRMKGEEERGFHIHGLMPTRAIGEDGHLGPKLNQLSNSRLSSIEIEQCRSDWANLCNDYAQRYGLNQTYTHLSHERLGDGLEAQVTLGVAASAMERRGVETDKGNALREQKAEQELRAKQERALEEKVHAEAQRAASLKAAADYWQRQSDELDQREKAWNDWQTTAKAAATDLKNHDRQVKQMREKEAETLKTIQAEQKRAQQQQDAWADRYGEHDERARNYAASVERSRTAASEAAETARTSLPLPAILGLGRKRREALETMRRETKRSEDYQEKQAKEEAKAKHAAENRDAWRAKFEQATAKETAEQQRQQAAEQQRAQQRVDLVAKPTEAWNQLTPAQRQQVKQHAGRMERERQEAEQRRLQQEEQERQRQQAEQRQQMRMQPPTMDEPRQRPRMRM